MNNEAGVINKQGEWSYVEYWSRRNNEASQL